MDTRHVQTLHAAALLVGGERQLAEFLDIETWLLTRWVEGLGHPPDYVFLRCTELIASRQLAAAVVQERDEELRSSR
jgi:hypothetical protein